MSSADGGGQIGPNLTDDIDFRWRKIIHTLTMVVEMEKE
jgi:hypothetical protein